MLVCIAESDEALMEKYFEDSSSITPSEIEKSNQNRNTKHEYYTNAVWVCI